MNDRLEGADLSAVLEEAKVVADETRRAFGHLSAAELNWKPDEGEWSIAQCYEHLVLSNRPFVPILERTIRAPRRPTLWERTPVLPGLFGRMLIRALRPDSGWKARARPAFLPSASAIEAGVIGRFLDLQDRLMQLLEATRHLDLDGLVITSPVSPIITYSLMDACRIIVVHEQNHFVQARRLVEAPAFGR
jgi:hypothetical protein